ncbi:MAG: YwiC-like family protein [Kofleriaceae bacterium]
MRSLWPREHGAYAQLGVPLATALLVRSPTCAAVLLALAACLAFLANEPLLVLLGHRGARIRQTLRRRAIARLIITAGGAALAAGAGLIGAPNATIGIVAVVAIPAGLMIALAATRSAHSLGGELVAAIALPGASATVLVASGASWTVAVALWCAWSLGYAATVIAVHRVLAAKRGDRGWSPLIALATIAIAVAASSALVVSAPLVMMSVVVAIWLPSPRRLRSIGYALVAASFASGIVAVTAG